MLKRVLAFAFLLVLAPASLAQFRKTPGRIEKVNLRILLFLQGEKLPYSGQVTVTVMSIWGDLQQSQYTNSGSVPFLLPTGGYRIFVIGNEVRHYEDEFSLDVGINSLSFYLTPRTQDIKKPEKTPEATVGSAVLNAPKNARKEFEKAVKAWKRNDIASAKGHLLNAIRLYPRYNDAYAALGELELAAGDFPASQRDLQKALEIDPKNVTACRDLAKLAISQQNYATAAPLLETYLSSRPQDPWALSFLALADLEQDKLNEALAAAQKVHALPHQGFESAHLIAARALQTLRRTVEARGEYQLYLDEAPNGPNAAAARQALQVLAAQP